MVDLAQLELRVKSLEVLVADKRLEGLAAAGAKAEVGGKKAAKGTAAANRSAARLNSTLQKTLRTMGPLLGAFAGFQALRSSVKVISSFEETLAQVRGIAIKTTETLATQGAQFDKLRAQAAELGATTRFTATQAGEAQLFLARAGFEVSEVLGALPGTLDLAAAGMLDLGTAADIASNVLNQFNLSAEDTNRVADVLVNTANSANTNVLQLAEAFKLAGPVAGALGVELELTAAALGTLGDAGIQASLAGTQLRGILGALSAPTRKAQTILDGLAASIGETAEVFDLTRESADGVTPPLLRAFDAFKRAGASAADFFQLFGRRQAAGAIILTQFSSNIRELEEANRAAAGEASRLARIMEDTLGGAFRSLVSAVEALVLGIGDRGLGAALRSLVDLLTATFRLLARVGKEAERTNVVAQLLAFTIRALVSGLIALLALKTIAFFVGLTTAAQAAGGAMLFLNSAVVANPLGALAVVLGLLVGGFFSVQAGIEAATRAQKELSEETKKLIGVLDSLASARAEERAAARRDDSEARIESIRQEIAALKRLQTQLLESGEPIAGPSVSRISFDREAILTVLQSTLDEAGLTIPFVPTVDPRSAEALLFDPSQFLEDQQAIEAAAKRAGDLIILTLGQVAEDSDFERRLIDPDKILALLQQLSGSTIAFFEDQAGKLLPDPDLVAARGRAIRTILEQILGDITVPQSTREALELIDQEIEAAGERIRTIQQSARAAGRTSEQAIALVDLAALEQELALEKQLASLSTEQAAIERELIKVRELADQTGLGEEVIERRVASIRATLEEVEAIKKSVVEQEKSEKVRTRAQESLDKFTAALQLETQLAGLSAREKEKARAVEDALNFARSAGIEDTKALVELIKQEVDARINLEGTLKREAKAREEVKKQLEEAAKARKEAQANLAEELKFLQQDIDAVFRTPRENRIATALMEIEELAKAAGIDVNGFLEGVESEFNRLENLRLLRSVANDISSAFGDAFLDVITGAATAEEAANAFVDTVTSALVDRLVVQPLVDKLTALITQVAAQALGLNLAGKATAVALAAAGVTAGESIAAGGLVAATAISAAAAELAAASFILASIAILRRGGVSEGRVTKFARGATSMDSNVTRYASGGFPNGTVVNRPTMIPQALLGEAGRPEGIFPLDKTLGGDLGIMASIGGVSMVLPIGRLPNGNLGVVKRFARGDVLGDQTSVSRFQISRGVVGGVGLEDNENVTRGNAVIIDRRTTFNQTVTTPDVPAFRRAEGQLRRSARKRLGVR